MNLSRIKPKNKGVSDKYSWNLYKFLNKMLKVEKFATEDTVRFYWNTYSRWDGEHLPFNGHIDFGRQGIISTTDNKNTGYLLDAVLREGRSELYAIPLAWQNTIDITDWFFDTYEKIGRCIFDSDHNGWMQHTDARYTYVNNTRKCNWCG